MKGVFYGHDSEDDCIRASGRRVYRDLTVLLLLTAHGTVSAKTGAVTLAAGAGQVSQGKALISTYRCNGCHGADLAGRPGLRRPFTLICTP